MGEKPTEYDVERALEEIGVDAAGPAANPVAYTRHELARRLFQKLHDTFGRWDGRVTPSPADDVIIGNG